MADAVTSVSGRNCNKMDCLEEKSKIYGVDPPKLESYTLVATPGENFDDPARRFQYDPLL